jgi:rhomboid family protein
MMGLYDRDYYGNSARQGLAIGGPKTMVGWLVIINVVLFVANGLLTPQPSNLITSTLVIQSGNILNPLLWWKLLTYGFAHGSIEHILFNMLALFFLGPSVERVYGPWEFLRIYLVIIVFGGAIWCLVNLGSPAVALLGASGAVTGIVLLFALHFPKQTLLLFFVIPVPAWVVGVLLIVLNLFGTAGGMQDNVAYSVHLAGAAFAFAYFKLKWNFGDMIHHVGSFNPRKPKLKIHEPDQKSEKMTEEVDRILAKIHSEGESSLTRSERKTLQKASKKFQNRK